MGLPCRHVFAARRHRGEALFDKALINARWHRYAGKSVAIVPPPPRALVIAAQLAPVSMPSTNVTVVDLPVPATVTATELRRLQLESSASSLRTIMYGRPKLFDELIVNLESTVALASKQTPADASVALPKGVAPPKDVRQKGRKRTTELCNDACC